MADFARLLEQAQKNAVQKQEDFQQFGSKLVDLSKGPEIRPSGTNLSKKPLLKLVTRPPITGSVVKNGNIVSTPSSSVKRDHEHSNSSLENGRRREIVSSQKLIPKQNQKKATNNIPPKPKHSAPSFESLMSIAQKNVESKSSPTADNYAGIEALQLVKDVGQEIEHSKSRGASKEAANGSLIALFGGKKKSTGPSSTSRRKKLAGLDTTRDFSKLVRKRVSPVATPASPGMALAQKYYAHLKNTGAIHQQLKPNPPRLTLPAKASTASTPPSQLAKKSSSLPPSAIKRGIPQPTTSVKSSTSVNGATKMKESAKKVVTQNAQKVQEKLQSKKSLDIKKKPAVNAAPKSSGSQLPTKLVKSKSAAPVLPTASQKIVKKKPIPVPEDDDDEFDEEEDEDDSLDGFVVDDDEVEESGPPPVDFDAHQRKESNSQQMGYRQLIRNMFKYHPDQYSDDGSDDLEVARFDDIMREEAMSRKIGRREDEEDIKREEEEKKRRRLALKKKTMQQKR